MGPLQTGSSIENMMCIHGYILYVDTKSDSWYVLQKVLGNSLFLYLFISFFSIGTYCGNLYEKLGHVLD